MVRIFLFFFSFMAIWGCTKSQAEPDETPSISVQDLSIQEGDGNSVVYLSFLLSAAAPDDVDFVVHTENGTAIANADYVPVLDTLLTISKGKSSLSLKINLLGDTLSEADEYFLVVINSVTGATLAKSTGVVTLENDDEAGTSFFIPSAGYTTPVEYPGKQLIWQDEFSGSSLNLQYWTYEYGVGNNGWGNNELQYYRAENTSVSSGYLVITAKEESFSGRSYTSSRLVTKDKFSFQYGRVDIRAALPYGQGIWPALWMLGSSFPSTNWPACGEIDIMEMIGGGAKNSDVYGTIHWSEQGAHAEASGKYTLPSGIFYDQFHVFSIEWDEQFIRWYVDDQPYHSVNITDPEKNEFLTPFFLIMNVAVGGNWPGSPDASTVFPQRMIVDYIRVFQDQ